MSAHYKNPHDMRFLRAGRFYFNNDVFSCAMVLLIILLLKTRINFVYVNIMYVYVTEFTLTATGLEPRTTWFVNKHSTIWPIGWVFVYELSGSGFESSCSHLKFRFHTCFEEGVPWYSRNYRVWIHSETRTWHDNNIEPEFTLAEPT